MLTSDKSTSRRDVLVLVKDKLKCEKNGLTKWVVHNIYTHHQVPVYAYTIQSIVFALVGNL